MVTNKERWFPLKEVTDFPVFTDVDDALKALALSLAHHRKKEGPVSGRKLMNFNRRRKTLAPCASNGMVDLRTGFSLLREYGIRVPDYAVVGTADKAIVKARELGYPVAVKISSPQVLHKTEAGGVKLNVENDASLGRYLKQRQADAYLIQKMIPVGIEVIVGGKRDSEFGPVILFGLGGIYVEVFRDTVLRVAPVDLTTASQMIDSIKCSKLLKGFRGSTPFDIVSLARALVNISRLLTDHPEITNLDINPLIVLEKGKRCFAVDVKMQIAN